MNKIKTMLAIAAALVCGGAWAASTPKLLLNVRTSGDAVTGWVDYNVGSAGPDQLTPTSTGDLSFATSGGGGRYWNTTATGTFTNGSYTDLFGKTHTSIQSEFQSSMGTDAELSTAVYQIGTRNGQSNEHTATISGLDSTKKYVVYVGTGSPNGGNQFKIQSSGYTSCGSRDYVVTSAGNNTTVATQYQTFAENTAIAPGNGGVMIVRLGKVVPKSDGTIVFSILNYSGMNFLAVAEYEPAKIGDAAVWSNLDYTTSAATHFTKGTGALTLHLEPNLSSPVGTIVAISAIKIANGNKTMANTMTINGVNGTKQSTTESFTSKSTNLHNTTIDRLFTYTFATPVEVEVGKDYPITMENSEFSAINDANSPIRIGGLSSDWANHHGYCKIESTIKTFPTLPNTISYTVGDPSDWQSTGVGVAEKDADSVLKELANRYTYAATFGNTAMDATPRDGAPRNVTLHSDGVLTVEMQVTNGGYKKGALIGFKVDGGLLKVKRIKSVYAATTFNGTMMTYANGTVTKASGVSDGSYILANVTLTRITKFKDDAVQPDFLSTTAPIIRYDASAYDNFTYNENGEVESWKDLSGNSNNARAGTTKGRVEIVNGVPAFQMGDAGSNIDLTFATQKTNIRTVFWVMDIKTTMSAFFLGDSVNGGNSECHFHRGSNGEYAGSWAGNGWTQAAIKCDGVAAQTSALTPTGLHVFSAVTTENRTASCLSQDRNQSGRNGGRAISELVVFDSVLTDEQVAAMNAYLLYKWMGIETGSLSATLPEGAQNFSEIAWDEGGRFANGKDVTLAVDSTTTLTIDAEVQPGTLTLTGAGTLTINNAQNLSFNAIDISGFTGTINYNVDATRAAFTASEGLKALMKSGTDKMTFTFSGSGANGAAIDYGPTQDSTTDVIFSCHIVFNGGTHALKYVHEKEGSKFGANATAENPTFLVTNNATLNFTGKNWCGWSSGAVNADGIIRVNSGSTLNASTDDVGTFYWAQQFYLEPGSTTNFRSNNNKVRFNGGINESAPQIYVPACAADKANKVATVNLANSADLNLLDEGTGGAAFFVGENATLKIGGNLVGDQNFTKYGDGILQITGNVTNTGTKTIAAGLYDMGATRDFTSVAWTTSGTGGFLIRETTEEYAKANIAVTNPNDVTIKVIRPNDATIYDYATVEADTEAKIDGIATIFDITFKNNKDDIGKAGGGGGHFDYKANASANLKWDNAAVFTKTADEEWDDSVGCYLRTHPYIDSAASTFGALTDFSVVVVGQMSPTDNTQFISIGSSDGSKTSILIATTEVENQVMIATASGGTVNTATAVYATIPNATTARHAYVITRVGNTMAVYADGTKRGQISLPNNYSLGTTGHSGIQVGSDFGGAIKGAGTYLAVANNESETGYINVIRVYDYVLNDAQQQAVFGAYPYISENGLFTRTLNEGENDLQATAAWTNSETHETADLPTANASATLTLTADSSLTLNANQAIEKLMVNGSHTLTVKAGTGTVSVSDAAVINTPVVIPYGTIVLAGTPITLGENGTLKFDCSALDVSADYVVKNYQLTGLMDEDNTKVTATLPTTDAAHTVELVYTDGAYAIKVTPDHENGSEVILNTSEYLNGNMDGKVELSDGTTTAIFPNDTVVIKDGKSHSTYVGAPVGAGIKTEIDVELNMGDVSNALDGKTLTVADAKTLTLNNTDRSWSFGSVTMNGLGAVLVKGTVSATAIAGDATLKLAEDATLTVGTELTVGRVVSNVSGKSVKKEEVADNKTKYSLIDTSTDPIEPSDDPEAEPVVIEDVGTGIAVQPNAKVEIALPEGATAEQKAEIAAKITIKYGKTVLNPVEGTKYVSVTIGDDGAVNVDTTEAATPAVTEMTEADESNVSITFTPIAGLFYTLESGDTPDSFTPGTPEQATSDTAKTLQLAVPTGDAKVKFYRVSVKATR